MANAHVIPTQAAFDNVEPNYVMLKETSLTAWTSPYLLASENASTACGDSVAARALALR